MDDRLPIIDRPARGHTLVEMVTVVLVLSILACVAVPRLNFGAVWGMRADALARRLATDLRHTRSLALTHAAANPEGFALVLQGRAPSHGYAIVDEHSRTTVTTYDFPRGVQCQEGRRFAFGPLGNLQEGSDRRLCFRTDDKTYLLEIVPATGAVTWQRASAQD